MAKENHFIPLLKKQIARIQEPVSRLVAPESHGPELDRFRSGKHTFFAWKNKQFQNWNFWGQLTTSTNRPIDFGLRFQERRNERDYLGVIPIYLLKNRFFGAQFVLIDPLNADVGQGYRFWSKGIGRNRVQGFSSEENFHLHQGSWNVFEKNQGSYILNADSEDSSLYLELEDQAKTPVFFGQSGYLDLGSEAGQSYFKAATPVLKARGKLVIGQKSEEVSGDVWFSHSKTSLPFHCDKNRSHRYEEVLVRLPEGKTLVLFLSDYHKCLTLLDANGISKFFVSSEFKIEEKEFWISPQTKNRYPIRRSLTVESLNLELTLKPVFSNQEITSLTSSFLTGQSTSWFGSMNVDGVFNGEAFKSRGFMSLEGSDKGLLSRVYEKVIRSK